MDKNGPHRPGQLILPPLRIRFAKTTRFAAADITEKGILILNLSSVVTVGGVKRPRKQK